MCHVPTIATCFSITSTVYQIIKLGVPWINGLLEPMMHFSGCFSFKSYNNFLELENLYAIYNKIVGMVAHLNLIGSMHAMPLVLRKKGSQYIREYCKT